MNKTIMHINYAEVTFHSYGKRTLDDVCRMAAEIGFDGIEFRGRPPIELKEMSFREYAAAVAASCKKHGLSEIMFSIGLAGCLDENREAREKCISDAIENARTVNELCGTTLCNSLGKALGSPIETAPDEAYEFHGSAIATPQQWEMEAEAYHRVGRELEKLGMRFALETHMYHIHDQPQATKRLVDLISSPAIGVNMDYGNTAYFPNRPTVEDTIDIYGDKLFYVHMKNSSAVPGTGKRIATSLSDGEINHRAYIEKLREVRFDGPIALEAPRDGDRTHFAKQDFEYFKTL